MRRKVIQIAESTQLISLPRKWCIQYGLKKGDELNVIEDGARIIVSPQDDEAKVEKINLSVDKFGKFTFRSIAALYKAGFDEIELSFKSAQNLDLLPKFLTEDLPGFEVFDHNENKYLIKSISKANAEEFDSALRRIFLITLSMSNNVVEILKNPKLRDEKINNIIAMESTTNRLCNFCERLLNKKGLTPQRKTPFVYTIIWELEKYSDQLKYLCQYLKEDSKVVFSKESIALFEDAMKVFEMFYNQYYKFNEENIGIVAEKRKIIIANALELMDKGKDTRLNHHTVYLTQMIFNMQGSLIGLRF